MKINLGCGPYKAAGYVNIDINPLWQPEIVRDLRRGLPFGDGQADEIIASHVLEHLGSDDVLFVLQESWRILQAGGILKITVPTGVSGDLEHKTFYSGRSFLEMTTDDVQQHYQFPFRWKEIHRSESKDDHCRMLHVQLEAVK